jgi:hypothetical protein
MENRERREQGRDYPARHFLNRRDANRQNVDCIEIASYNKTLAAEANENWLAPLVLFLRSCL